MSSLASTVSAAAKRSLPGTTANQKLSDLSADTVDVNDSKGLTTDYGIKISDTDTWLKVTNGNTVGPNLLEDQIAREKIHRFDHERIPERVVHARGTGAHGYFKVFDNRASKYTFAPVLTDSSRVTPVFVRFSTVAGSRGSADTVRDVRGFAIKFYAQEGNWDIVGNDIPVFFIQDSIKFPDIIHAVKPEPHNEVPQAQSAHNNFWDFFNLQTETSHMIMWHMSDRAIPRSYRMMQGFGVNTFTLVNTAGEKHFVKFTLVPELGVHSLVWDEALKLAGQDPDFHRKDLQEAIDSGAPPKWTFGIQVIPEANEHDFDFDILDATKVWPEELVPFQPIGELVLDRNVDEFFPETEQVAFCTSHVVPGIGFSDDPLLQGRNFSYFDTQITRLGVNWQELPINRPVCPVINFNRDGQLRHKITKGKVNYWPNRFDQVQPVPAAQGGYVEHPTNVNGVKARMRGQKFAEHFNQAQLFYNSLTESEKLHVVSAFAFELDHCDDPLVYENAVQRINQIDGNLARKVAAQVGGPMPKEPGRDNHGMKSASLSQFFYMPKVPTIKSRRIAILVADGFDASVVQTMQATILSASAVPFIIGPRRGNVYPAGESTDNKEKAIWADHHFEGQRSTMFDAILIPSGPAHAEYLGRSGRVIHWVREAFGHLKAIGAIGEGVKFLRDDVQLPGIKLASVIDSADVTVDYGVVTAGKLSQPNSATDAIQIVKGSTGFAASFFYEVSQHRNFDRELAGLHNKVAF
ncbi:catalase-domain-containing protein [Rickenella mellea]|uniref:Catalase n=1 Tax=Rickenella mellea TaxID=50990 RepID=A0A4Y7Q8L8_9AGAM|nr:catalase-domain-containing protein [Rickenella mellea]